MTKPLLTLFVLTGLIFTSCEGPSSELKRSTELTKTLPDENLPLYQSENLIIRKKSNHIYEHISYLNTNDYGKVGCNGMLVINEDKGIIFDTPTDNKASLELIDFVTKKLKTEIIAVVPTHFHKDCIGGIQPFEKRNIEIYANFKTIKLLNENGYVLSKPINGFDTSKILNLGNKNVYLEYFGEGHTKDNIIGYFPEDEAIFGGCLIKRIGASKGYLGDANTNKWSETVKKIKLKYPNAELVIPGHGKSGGKELFDYTIELFKLK